MREIKFRCWDAKWSRMAFSDGDDKGNCDVTLFRGDWEMRDRYENGDHGADNTIDGKRFFLMQYTGLKDKNGKEIYESDIIEAEHWRSPAEVKWIEHGFWVETGKDRVMPNQEDRLIIGNIYENPDLLKGE